MTLPNLYTSHSILEVVDAQDQSSAMSSLSNQFGGIASLAGINLNSSSPGSKNFWVIERIKSKEFSDHISKLPTIKESLFALEYYDSESKKLIFDESKYKDSQWQMDDEGRSTEMEFFSRVQGSLYIDKNTETGFIELSFTHQSPVFAAHFLNSIISEINQQTRSEQKKKAESSLSYLRTILTTTPIKEIKDSMSALIENQTKVLMLADLDEYFILKPIDPPFEPEQKSTPSRMVICLIGFFVGLMFGSLYEVIRFYYKNK